MYFIENKNTRLKSITQGYDEQVREFYKLFASYYHLDIKICFKCKLIFCSILKTKSNSFLV